MMERWVLSLFAGPIIDMLFMLLLLLRVVELRRFETLRFIAGYPFSKSSPLEANATEKTEVIRRDETREEGGKEEGRRTIKQRGRERARARFQPQFRLLDVKGSNGAMCGVGEIGGEISSL